MPFTFKLSRRIAMLRFTPFAIVATLAACSDDAPSDPLSPQGPSANPSAVVVMPQAPSIPVGETVRFAAFTHDADGDSATVEVEWQVSGGRIASDGVFSATSAGTYKVVASDPVRERADTATVTVLQRDEVPNIVISPDTAALAAGERVEFAASTNVTDGTPVQVPVTWVATGGTVDSTGGYTAGSVPGTFHVVATRAGQGGIDTAVVVIAASAPPPPPSAGEPEPRAGQSYLYNETFESFSSTAGIEAAYSTTVENKGTFNLESSSAAVGGKSMRIDWRDNSKGSCTDGSVLLGQKLPENTAQREINVSYYFKFEQGYLFAWPKGSRCRGEGGVTSKEMLFFRNGSNADGRITLNISGAAGGGTPNIYGDLKEQLWGFTIAAVRGSSRPATTGHKSYIRQHLALGDGGVDKRPSALRDGQWHRLTMRFVKESVTDAGDGTIQMWIDGVMIMDYQGDKPGHPAYKQVYTRASEFSFLQYQSVLNRGAPQAQSRWFDDIKIWNP